MVTLYSCLFQQQGCVCAEPGRTGREEMTLEERSEERKDGERL